jgi:hypothetical protein
MRCTASLLSHAPVVDRGPHSLGLVSLFFGGSEYTATLHRGIVNVFQGDQRIVADGA